MATSSALTQSQRVTRLYRNSLKHLLSWTIDRQAWRGEALGLRARFDEHKHEKDLNKAIKLIEDGEEEFHFYKHPDPYISEFMFTQKNNFNVYMGVFSTRGS